MGFVQTPAALIVPSPDEWSFSELPAKRQAYLESDMPFEQIARTVADRAVVKTGFVDPLQTTNLDAPTGITWRACFTISVELDQISDKYYNGRDGLRGRYWQDEEAGKAATALSIDLLSEKLLQFAADNPDKFGSDTLARGEVALIERSLRAQSAKTWAYEKPDQNFNAGPKLMVRRWANNRPGGNWRWAPVGPLLDIKGAFYRPDNIEFVPWDKKDRAYQIHRYGFS